MKYLAIVVLVAGLAWLAWYLMSRKQPPAAVRDMPESPALQPQPESALEAEPPKGPPPSGAADPLEVMRGAVAGMDTEDIENALEMGADLKPGAEELFRAELARRRAEEE